MRNEADIIEAFVRHHLIFVERLYVLNHGSVDGTLDILRQLAAEGLPLEILTETRLGDFQAEWTTQLLRTAAQDGEADWLAALDADEFLQFPGDTLDLPLVTELEQPFAIDVPLRTYVGPVESDVLNPLERMKNRLIREPSENCKVIVPRGVVGDGWMDQGNHRFFQNGHWLPTRRVPGLSIAHFPARAPGQAAAKTATHFLQNSVRTGVAGEPQDYRHEPYRKLQQSFSAYQRNFPGAIPDYMPVCKTDTVLEPARYRGGALRWTQPRSDVDHLVTVVLGHAAMLAEALAAAPSGEESRATPLAATLRLWHTAGSGKSVMHALLSGRSIAHGYFLEMREVSDGKVMAEVGGGPGAIKVQGLKFYASAAGAPPVQWIGPDLSSAMRSVSGAFRIVRPGGIFFLKPYGPALLEIAMPGPEILASCAGVEIELSYDDDMASIGRRLTAHDTVCLLAEAQHELESARAQLLQDAGAARDVQGEGGEKRTKLRDSIVELQSTLATLRNEFQALQTTHAATGATSAFWEQKANEAQSKIRFLKRNPINRLQLELGRVWRRLFAR